MEATAGLPRAPPSRAPVRAVDYRGTRTRVTAGIKRRSNQLRHRSSGFYVIESCVMCLWPGSVFLAFYSSQSYNIVVCSAVLFAGVLARRGPRPGARRGGGGRPGAATRRTHTARSTQHGAARSRHHTHSIKHHQRSRESSSRRSRRRESARACLAPAAANAATTTGRLACPRLRGGLAPTPCACLRLLATGSHLAPSAPLGSALCGGSECSRRASPLLLAFACLGAWRFCLL
jgi:hypothetical protein